MDSISMKDISKTVTTMEESKPMNIYQRLLKIQSDLQNVAKNLTIKTGGRTYKAVCERDVLDAVKDVEDKCGVYSYCYDREIVMTQETTSQSGTVNFWQRMKCKYRFVNVDNPSEYIETVSYADGIDTLDKGSGKAMTYADKYALMKVYKISTGDDPDKDKSEEQDKTTKKYVNEIASLTAIWSEKRRRMEELGISCREPHINQWICEKIGAESHAACNDVQMMKKICSAYDVLIQRKLEQNAAIS